MGRRYRSIIIHCRSIGARRKNYTTTGAVINCGYYREIALLNHARYASANISPREEKGKGTMAFRKCESIDSEYLCDVDN